MKYTFRVSAKGNSSDGLPYWIPYEITTTAGNEQAARDQINLLLIESFENQCCDLIDFEEEESV